jgi:hypothetical protein
VTVGEGARSGHGRAEQSRRGSGSGSAAKSQSRSPELSRRESLQQQQQQVLSREISREDSSVAMGVSLQEIEIEKGSGRQSKGKEKGKDVVR